MAKSYTPGLKVLKYTKIIKDRIIPLKGDVHVKMKDNVKAKEIVASTKIPGNVHMINVANKLSIEPNQINEHKSKDYIQFHNGKYSFVSFNEQFVLGNEDHTVMPRYNAPRYNADLVITRFFERKFFLPRHFTSMKMFSNFVNVASPNQFQY